MKLWSHRKWRCCELVDHPEPPMPKIKSVIRFSLKRLPVRIMVPVGLMLKNTSTGLLDVVLSIAKRICNFLNSSKIFQTNGLNIYKHITIQKREIQLCFMMASSNGNIFRVIGHLCGEFTGLRWNPRTNAIELWCFLSVPEWTFE